VAGSAVYSEIRTKREQGNIPYGAMRPKLECDAQRVLIQSRRKRFCNQSPAMFGDPADTEPNPMSNNDWWSWVVIGTFFLLTTPATYVPIGWVLGFF
jgi:hypothetical protein